ncbi:hypothetical protein A9K75_07875 [Campylobacter fetus subsp. testudinum]|uniref:hypothetical protein n=1 Tax=Campylobacter fetus TaxID=196 RepID=UPI00081896A0|nr:hypothetical protein [Campylobacter fetus]OCR99235.1 hypothetical protein A9K75_07875 [Campylobacter fetus subsp. testudinum]
MASLEISYTKAQKKVFFESEARFRTVAKGRRLGFTRGCANYVIECLLDNNFKIEKVLWVDTVNRNIQNYFELYFMPILKQIDSTLWNWSKQDKKLTVINGNVLHMLGADRPENIEGLGYDLIILNEAGIILKNASLWDNSISPMLLDNPNSRAIIGGVPKGKNRFFDLAGNGIKGVEGWEHFTFSSFDNPLLKKDEINRLIDELGGLESEVVKQEIYGEFVDGSSNVLLSLDLIEKAFQNQNADDSGEKVWACDVARYGDDKSVLAKRSGYYVYKFRTWSGLNTEELALEICREYENAEEKPQVIFIDTTGVGAGVFDKLETRGLPVREAIMSAKATEEKFVNKRSEMYYTLSHKLKYLKIEANENIKKQSQTIEYFYNSHGKIQIISKDAIKKLYGKSPDELDALAMLFYEPVFVEQPTNSFIAQSWSGNGL